MLDNFTNNLLIDNKIFCKIILNDIGYNYIGEPTCVMIRKRAFQKFGAFNPNLIQLCDLEFFARVAIESGIVHIPETLATFRVHNASTTARNNKVKQFRKRFLDKLILLHEFAISPSYTSLREVARSSVPPCNLLELLVEEAYHAFLEARNNSEYMQEWQKVTAMYPMLSKLPQLYLLRCIYWDIRFQKRWLSKQLNDFLKR
jgi:hypothetical protein